MTPPPDTFPPQPPPVPSADGASPVMAQFLEVKAANRDALVFFRMGDFYELFFHDAEVAAAALDIALTRRGQHQGADIPMAGVPVHAAEAYLQKLIRAGHRVAICEQVEDPAAAKKRGSKAVVAREVVRILTPGTLTEEGLLSPRADNWLAALAEAGGALALAFADVSTGAFRVASCTAETLGGLLARIEPAELLVPDALFAGGALRPILDDHARVVSPLPGARFDSASGERALTAHFAVASLDAFGSFSRAEIAAAGAVLTYLTLTQKSGLPRLTPPRREDQSNAMALDAATRRNLEILRTMNGERAGSLLGTLDRTVTAGGGRELARRLAAPLIDPDAIGERLDAVAHLIDARDLRARLRDHLKQAPDLARALARITARRGGPRDLAALRDGLRAASDLRRVLAEGPATLAAMPALLIALGEAMTGALSSANALSTRLEALLAAEPPLHVRDGGAIVTGAHAPLDEQRALRDESRRVIAALETRYREETGIASLKIRHNAVIGHHVEVSAVQAPRLMDGPLAQTFRHRQTMANAMRFSTDELSALARAIDEAAERALAIEAELIGALIGLACAAAPALDALSAALAELDVHTALSERAGEDGWSRPRVDASRAFRIEAGRHPVIEAALAKRREGPFVPNDCDLSGEGTAPGRIELVTGPNMAGKSTWLRQNALIAVLAQTGSFVPARAAHIGVVDRLFSRVGAADDLARGRSTFMVEMVETAAILNQAGERALVILDEIGRGTATYDGLSIAWATLEHLHDVNRARALFATHYHELTALEGRLERLGTVRMAVREWQGDIVFLHEVTRGVAERSYGVAVARLAGLPGAVTARAAEVLDALEAGGARTRVAAIVDDLPLFAAQASPAEAPASPLEEALGAVEPDQLSPRGALDLIYRLKALMAGG